MPAVAIAAARREWARLATALIAENGAGAAFPAAGIALEGVLEVDLAGRSAGEVEDRYRATLAADRPRDAAAGRTLSGPHLSDLRVRHEPKQAAAETCSTGEQKAVLVAIVLAHARLAAIARGRPPLLLLDEIAAHLDSTKRAALFDEIEALAARLEALLGERTDEWVHLDSFLKQYGAVPDIARTARASSFGATLEMAREGLIELSQAEPFAPIFLRKREPGADWQRLA